MKAFVRTSCLLSVSAFATACSSFGPQEIYNRRGLVPDPLAGYGSVYSVFADDAKAALTSKAAADLGRMHETGFNLVKINCAAFYRQMGVNERRSRITRNLLAPVSTILTGVLALHDWSAHTNQKEDILQIITLGASAGATALDVYDEHFLFKSNNIDSVRTMTMNELDEKKEKVSANLANYSSVVVKLMEYQNICSPSHIVVRAPEKIQS